jgi:hypothetical protein
MKCSGVRVAVMSMLLAVVATSLAVAEKEHCSLAQELEEEAVLLERHQDVVHHHPESEHTTTNAAEPQQAQKPGRLTEKQQRQQKREQRQALKESVVAVMRAQEQAFEAQRDELEANNDNDAGEPEFDLVLGDMQLKMARLAQQEQEDPRLRRNYAHSVPVPAFKEKEEKKVEAKGQKVGWGGSLEVPARGMESRGSWSWGWSKSSSQGGGGKTSRPRADS